jgi:hypothetical protein
MAKVKMDFRDLDDYELPDVCMQCGASAEGRKSKQYSWYHPALNLLIFGGLPGWIILAVLSQVLAKRRKVRRPLCAKHINQFPWRTATVLGGFALVVVIAIAAFLVMLSDDRIGRSNELAGLICVGTLAIFLVWLLVVVVIQSTAIRPTEITDNSITLTNVSKKFALAYEDLMEQASQSRIDDEVRDRSRDRDRKRRPKSSRPPSDAFEAE